MFYCTKFTGCGKGIGIMAKNKEIKTNAMRILDTKKIPYTAHTYECDEFKDGIQIADMLGLPHEKVYKTLVTQGNSKNYFVLNIIPSIKSYQGFSLSTSFSCALLHYTVHRFYRKHDLSNDRLLRLLHRDLQHSLSHYHKTAFSVCPQIYSF